MGDGNGWVRCRCGEVHWGLHGAAGLLVSTGTQVLLQLRATWTHNGGTWALPGGARDSHEDPITAARREVAEETSLDLDTIVVYDQIVDEHGSWSYTTILAHTPIAGRVDETNAESDAMRWWPIAQVETLPLHFGFAASWPRVRRRIVTDSAVLPGHGRVLP